MTRVELKNRLKKWIHQSISLPLDANQIGGGSVDYPIYDMKKGDRVLLVFATEYDHDVMLAYAEAFREMGADVEVLGLELGKFRPEDCAAEEARSLTVGLDNPCYTSLCNVISGATAVALGKERKYNIFVGGTAGPRPILTGIKAKWKRTPYISSEEVSSPLIEFPYEVQQAIDQKVFHDIMSLEKARLTDPEGTDVSWTNYDDGRTLVSSHEMGKPANPGRGGKADCSGVLAGTLNHIGPFPHIRAYLKDDLVVKVDGGGKYGEAWREKIEQLNKLELPPIRPGFTRKQRMGEQEEKYKLPGPGFFWFWEMAIGTRPKIFRLKREASMKNYANFLHDRLRAGYVHNGFGAPTSGIFECTDANIPWTHVHIHCQFATIEGTTKDGSKLELIKNGHLLALDDSEVRKIASKYGDPDALLSESWVPAVPGINIPGDYFKEYASDPLKWIMADANNYDELELI